MGEVEGRKGGKEGSVESLPSWVSDGKRVTWLWWRGLPWVAARPRVLQRARHARAGTSSTVRSRLTRSDPPPQQDRGGDADAGLARAARRGVWAWRRSTPQPTPRTTQDEGCGCRDRSGRGRRPRCALVRRGRSMRHQEEPLRRRAALAEHSDRVQHRQAAMNCPAAPAPRLGQPCPDPTHRILAKRL